MSAKILLAEDNATNRYLVTYLLEGAGFAVVQAGNGADALRLALAESPDLVLMDIQMPEMDGYEVAQRLRADPQFTAVPIVALTSYAMVGDRARAQESGFAGYLEKPINTETFISEITQFLSGKNAPA